MGSDNELEKGRERGRGREREGEKREGGSERVRETERVKDVYIDPVSCSISRICRRKKTAPIA